MQAVRPGARSPGERDRGRLVPRTAFTVRSRTSSPSRRRARRWPGRSIHRWPRQSDEQRVDRQHVLAGELGGRGAGVEGGAVEDAAAQRRRLGGEGVDVEAAVGRARGERRRPASSSSRAVSSRSWSAVRARASATPGPELVLEHRQHPVAHPDAGVGGVVVVRVVPRLEPLDLAGGDGVVAAYAEQRAREDAEGRPHPLQRPPARAAGQAEQHGLGLVVEGVAEQHQRGRRGARRPPPGRRTSPPGRPPRARAPTRRRPATRAVIVSSTPIAASCSTTRSACSAEPGCSPWSTVTPTTRRPRLWPSKTAAEASASESAPPLHATATATPSPGRRAGDSAGGPGSRTAATEGWSVTARGRPRRRGRRSRPWTAASPGPVQTALNSSMPTLSTTWRTKTAPSRYCAILASRPSRRRSSLSRVPTPLRRWLNFLRICSTRGITVGPTPSITTSAWPSSSDITPVTRSRISFCSGEETRSSTLPPPPRIASAPRRSPSSSALARWCRRPRASGSEVLAAATGWR